MSRYLCLVVYCSPEVLKQAIDEAIQTYQRITHSSEFYVQAQFEIIQCHIENKDFSLAKTLLEHFIKTFSDSSFTKEAEKLRMQIVTPAFEKKQ